MFLNRNAKYGRQIFNKIPILNPFLINFDPESIFNEIEELIIVEIIYK